MLNLDGRTLALIAVGASVSANCQPCLERNIGTALKYGADVSQIMEAIEIGKKVRQGAANKMDTFISNASDLVSVTAGEVSSGCACNP